MNLKKRWAGGRRHQPSFLYQSRGVGEEQPIDDEQDCQDCEDFVEDFVHVCVSFMPTFYAFIKNIASDKCHVFCYYNL